MNRAGGTAVIERPPEIPQPPPLATAYAISVEEFEKYAEISGWFLVRKSNHNTDQFRCFYMTPHGSLVVATFNRSMMICGIRAKNDDDWTIG